MKNFFLLLAAVLGLTANAQIAVVDIAVAGTAYNALATPATLTTLSFTSTTTNTAILRLYDSATTTTNYVRAAYTNWVSYATNFSTVFTNGDGILVTNTFDGTFSGPVTVAAATNTLPVVAILIAAPNSTVTKQVTIPTARGLTAVGSGVGVLEVDYRR